MRTIRNVKFVLALMKIRLSRQMAHAPSFWSALWIDAITFLIQAATFLAIYSQVEEINGWNRWQSVFFVGTFQLIDGIYMFLYFFGVLRIPEAVTSGKLDAYLTKPVDPLLHLSFESIDPGSGMIVVPAVALLCVSASNMGIPIDALCILGYGGAVALMVCLTYSLMILARLPVFALKRIDAFSAAEQALFEMAFRVPGSAYRGAARLVFRVIVPYGLIASLPSEIFFSGGGWQEWLLGVSVTGAFLAMARLGWKLGLRRYESTGS
jgi:ABC-2 type transport system permease protein